MADLAAFLRAIHSGNSTMTPEMYQHFGGDDILAKLQKYDPSAHWTDTDMGGGEGGMSQAGKRLDFDVTKLPKSKMGDAALDLRPSNFGSNGLYRPDLVDEDEIYGSVTNSKNVKKGKSAWWETAAPMAIGMLAPMAGAALMAGGIGGAAGLTAGVTGSGLGAGGSTWLASLLKGAPGLLDQLKAGNYAGAGMKAGGTTLSQLAGRYF